MHRAEQIVAFYPSVYSYGPSYGLYGDAVEQPSWSTEDMFKAARAFLIGEDPQKEAAVLEQKILNMQQMAANATLGVQKNFYIREIAKLQAKLAVAQQQAADSAYATQTLQVTQTSAAITSAMGILIAGGLVVGIGVWINNKMKESKLKDLEIQRLQSM